MALSVGGRLIMGPTMLSAHARMTLSFIDGGLQWTAWATQSPANRYHFPDESEMLDQVQKGLHASPTAWLPGLGLHVSPLKLMTLGAEDLRALALYESDPKAADALVTAEVQKVLAKHDLIPAGGLATVPTWLETLGVGESGLFAALGLDDTLLLGHLATEMLGHDDSQRREAAAFSVQHARSPAEFGDYYRFYLERPAQPGSTPQARSQDALETMQSLLPTLFETLGGPVVSNLPSPDEVRQIINNWMAMGRTIGYSRVSLALQQVARAAGSIEGSGAAQEATHRLFASANAFLIQMHIKHGVLGQSGSTVCYTVESEGKRAVVEVKDGFLSLIEFGAVKARSADASADEHAPDSPARQADTVQQMSSAPMAPPVQQYSPAPPPVRQPPRERQTSSAADESIRRAFATTRPNADVQNSSPFVNEAIRSANAAVEQALAASDAAIRAALDAHSQAVAAAEDAMRRSSEAHAEAERQARAAIEDAERSTR